MKNLEKYLFIAFICVILIIFGGTISAVDLNITALPGYNNLFVKMANDEGISFDYYNNSTYYIQDLGSGGGLNAIHMSNNCTPASTTSTANYGQYTFTQNKSGTFYVTDTGGRGYQDDVILMLAVNGTIPDDFAVNIKASGYNWTPGGTNTAPSVGGITYHSAALSETFYKNDFRYGFQNWKPAGGSSAYPLYYGEDMSDTSNNFSVMFIDLHAGLLGSNYGSTWSLTNYGAVKVDYSFKNLNSLAVFNVYAWNAATTHGSGAGWTNSILPGQTGGPSGCAVNASSSPTAGFTENVTSGVVPLTVQFTDESSEDNLTYNWDFGDGTTSTEKNPVHTYNASGNYTVTLNVTNGYGSDEASTNIVVSDLSVSADLPSGSYNSSQTVNLTATDNTYPNPKIYYTLDGSDPTASSTLYNGPISLDTEGNTILKFIAVDDGGCVSDIVTRNYTIDKTGPTVNASPASGTYNARTNITLKATDNFDSNPKIYYTTDSSDPQISSTRTEYTDPIMINSTTNLKFTAVDASGNWAATCSETYTMNDTDTPVVTADLPSGSYNSDQVVKLTATDKVDSNPKIYYTLDGSNPTTKSTLYDGPISMYTVGTTFLKFIAVDAAGHVSNVSTRNYTINKAASSGTWNSSIIYNVSMLYNSIAIDSLNYPHIAFYKLATSEKEYPELEYAYKDASGWHVEDVESTKSGSGYFVSLALDSSNNPHMIYWHVFGDNSSNELRYAYKNSTGWHFTTLEVGSDISYINMVLYKNQPRLSYYNNTARNGQGELEYMYQNGTKWFIENVTANSSGGGWNSLAVDSSGNPKISYYDIYSGPILGSLRYAERTSAGVWVNSIVDSSDSAGLWNSIAVNSSGNPYISYSTVSGSLKCAYWNGTNWNIETVDNLSSSASKIAIDKSGNPLIVYQDILTSNLKYAYKEGSNWIVSNVNTIDGAGHWISLALNSNGTPYVSYESANARLGYAYLVPFVSSASPSGGVYNNSQKVNLTATLGTSIYYTTDGSDPRTSNTSKKCTGPISLTNTTVLKFAPEDSAENWGSVHTETYIINDIVAPTISAITPAKNAVLNSFSSIKVTLSEAIKFGTGTITLKNSKGTSIAFTKSINGLVLTITPKTSLASGTYTLTLGKGSITDINGNSLAAYTSIFTLDKTAPALSAACPKSSATGVLRTKAVSIRFSENIIKGVNWSKVYIKNLKTGQKCKITAWVSGNHVYISTNSKKAASTWYQVYIPASAIKDSVGNNLPSSHIWKFKTGKS